MQHSGARNLNSGSYEGMSAPRRASITADPPAELAERQRFASQLHVVEDDVVRQRVHIQLRVHLEYGQDAPEAAATLAGVAEELAY